MNWPSVLWTPLRNISCLSTSAILWVRPEVNQAPISQLNPPVPQLHRKF